MAPAPRSGPAERVLTVVAHADDDLLFSGTRLQQLVEGGHAVRSVVVTAGDAGRSASYWKRRETGLEASYALLAGVPSTWSTSVAQVAGKTIRTRTLVGDPRISIVFLQLPDGNMDGSGFWRTGRRSLQRLRTGSLRRIRTVRGAEHPEAFTIDELRAVLTGLFEEFAPTIVHTLDHVGDYGDGDHSDHHTVAYLTDEVQRRSAGPHRFSGYLGYPVAERPSNLTPEQVAAKQAAFFAYAAYDGETCSTEETCALRPEGAWLRREYTVV
ncbi:PIG-L family deacetylase [Curtobacterium pusillum]|uniref:PIG-L family deacetylase n=1 Tax=Curtobacterium pusillum TaxID=69373 RepID=UPI0011A6D3B4|nr:PIG-L family deacetylase [Curtobacterium pusillum]